MAVRARDGLAGEGNWGPRPGHAPGDELAGHVGGDPGATSCAGDPGARREGAPATRRHLQTGRALSGGSSQGSTLCHTDARAGAGGGGCLLDEGTRDADGGRGVRGHAVPS